MCQCFVAMTAAKTPIIKKIDEKHDFFYNLQRVSRKNKCF